ncbi:MAG: hypothetical protein KTR31_20170 [Myxococcales bacterium]|nr:hypothetical protein [Myxococcales bacterium]
MLTLSRPVHLGEDPVPAGNLVRQGADGTVERIDQVVSSYRNTVTLRGFAEGDELYAGTIYNNAVLHGGVTVPAPDDQILLLRRRPEGEIVWHTTLDASQMRLHDTATT